ncbi:9a6bcd60-0d52-4b5c-8ab5-f1ecde53fb23 [Thermothielavioides terrestris]|uniref:9a6bcd60-0d52-4b5c-8ab5-f1ecde53fb23 n=1 Tax=Thermothielavioides terrestris TaxID=2587410 RepID=A0A446BCD1_9PEZI|nr:9a6bcd60-0d52-4b5c-8ab5-f1ecde53fb23 [Thermothielavioides terrestris]
MSIQAIILICLLFFDVVLDVVTLFRAQRRWPTWVLALRFGIGIAYIVLFLLYVGLGGVFPNGYTYWGVPVDSSATPVYVLLCVEGLWDLLHIPVCRYALGSSLLGRASARPNTSTTPDSRTTFNHRFSVAGTEHSSISLTWQRWVRAGSAHHSRDELETGLHRNGTPRGPSVDLTLREHPDEEEEDDDDDEGGSSRPGSSHERKDEESGLQGGGEEKWDEDKSEGRAAHRVRAADIGQ